MKALDWVAAGTAVLLLACAGKQLDVGSDGAPRGGSDATNGASSSAGGADTVGFACAETLPQDPSWPLASDCMPAPDSPLVGSWRGHWPDQTGSLDVEGELSISGLTAAGVPCGSFTVGQGSDPPPATDATAYYPPRGGNAQGGMGSYAPPAGPLFQGHEYPLTYVESSAERLAFRIPSKQMYRSWCQLQSEAGDTGLCFDGVGSGTSDGVNCTLNGRAVSCAQWEMCARAQLCRCDGACCDAATDEGIQVDLHWDHGALEGSVTGLGQIFLDPVPAP